MPVAAVTSILLLHGITFENHFRSYGEFSPAVQSYVNYDIQDWMNTEEFKTLLSYVEPFSFKENFTMPKYIINAGSDEFFSTDSWRFYYDKLPGDKLLRYVPNTNHSLNGRYLNDDLLSYFYRIINDIDMPTLKWDLIDNNLNDWEIANNGHRIELTKSE